MNERLPHKTFDKLAHTIWELGKLTMRRMFEEMPVPSVMKGEIDQEGLCLEPHFLIRHQYPESLSIVPRQLGITISETEPYSKNEEFTVYSFEELELDTQKRSRTFSTGIQLLDPRGRSARLALDLPGPGVTRRRRGTQAWRNERTQLEKAEFGPAEADRFLRVMTETILDIKAGNIDE